MTIPESQFEVWIAKEHDDFLWWIHTSERSNVLACMTRWGARRAARRIKRRGPKQFDARTEHV